ncbi:serine-aspartate repeat-containing protein F-like isoform X1 [Pecten maximus]|uniref:serine-aspartate repeat-containing protein F-like isoform X1 n=1 Tax=Pecten maximus TaxID=6579 RepID=UPI001458D490|nr:serine-aspartate repeat-containing protein F-like isoform X1 [Pecten maximus]
MIMVRFVIFLSITALLSIPGLAAPFSSDTDVIEDVNNQITQTLDQILDSDTGADMAEDDRKKREIYSVNSPYSQTKKDDDSDEKSDATDETSEDEDVNDIRRKRSILDEISSIGSPSSSSTPIQPTNDVNIDEDDGNDDDDDADADNENGNDDENDRRKRDIESQLEEDEDNGDDIMLERRRRDTETEIDGNEDNDDDNDEFDENDISVRRKRDTDSNMINDEDIDSIMDMVKRDTRVTMVKPAAGVKAAPVDKSGNVLITRKSRDVSGKENTDSDDDDDDDDDDDVDEDVEEKDNDDDKNSKRKKRDIQLKKEPVAHDKVTHSDESDDVPVIRNVRDNADGSDGDDDREKKRKKNDLRKETDENDEDDDFDEDDDGTLVLRRKRDLSDDEDDDNADIVDEDDNDENLERRKREAFENVIGLNEEDNDSIIRVRRTVPVKPASPTPQPSSNTTSPTPLSTSEGLLQKFLQRSTVNPFTASASNDDDDDDDDDNEADDDDDDDSDDDDDDDDDVPTSKKKKELKKQLRSLVKSMRRHKREAPGYVPRYTDADDDLQKNDIFTENRHSEINLNNTQKHTHIHIREPSDFSINGISRKSASTMIDVHPHAPEITQLTSSNDVSLATTKHMGGEPSGPIATKRSLGQRYSTFFTKDAKRRVSWVEPKMMKNCWAQTMLASRFGYSPSCNADGSFSPKQCFLERCWCVHKDGSPENQDINTRFVYSIAAIMMECAQNP